MLGMLAPLGNGITIGPIGNSDANPIITTNRLNPKKAGLLLRQSNHAISGDFIHIIAA